MTRLASAVRLEVTLQVRQRFLHAAVFSGLIWLAVLLPMPHHLRPVAEPYVLLGDLAIIGFFFVGGSVFFEKQERTLGAGGGLVAATRLGGEAPTWIVTGTDRVGLAAAAAVLEEKALSRHFAVAVEDGRPTALPLLPPPEAP